MKRSWIAMFAAAAAMVTVAATAQAESKIGVVNFSRLLQESPQGKAATDLLRKEAEAKQGELASLQSALKAKEDRLTKDGATMTADQRTRAEKELRDGSRDLQTKTKSKIRFFVIERIGCRCNFARHAAFTKSTWHEQCINTRKIFVSR